MSIYRWLATSKSSTATSLSFLTQGDATTDTANRKAVEVLDESTEWKRKRGQYHHYSGELRAKIAKYACENGNKATLGKFSVELGYVLSEATVRNYKRKYIEKLKATPNPDDVTSLPHATLGRPLLIGKFDEEVFLYIKHLKN